MMRRGLLAFLMSGALSLGGCISLIGGYDPAADQILNQMSEQTAMFLASAGAGKQARVATSNEAITYYAGAYDTIDRLILRAESRQGPVPCAASAGLPNLLAQPGGQTQLPDDYRRFDCRQLQLYVLRFTLDQMKSAQDKDGILSVADIDIYGTQVKAEIQGAITIADTSRP